MSATTGNVVNMTFAATSGIVMEAGSQSLMTYKPSAESRVGAPARNFIHIATIPIMIMNADAQPSAVATKI